MDKDTKDNNSLSILQYNSALFTELLVPLLQGFEKLFYLFYLFVEVILLMSKTS